MHYFITVDHNGTGMKRTSPEVTVKGCQKC